MGSIRANHAYPTERPDGVCNPFPEASKVISSSDSPVAPNWTRLDPKPLDPLAGLVNVAVRIPLKSASSVSRTRVVTPHNGRRVPSVDTSIRRYKEQLHEVPQYAGLRIDTGRAKCGGAGFGSRWAECHRTPRSEEESSTSVCLCHQHPHPLPQRPKHGLGSSCTRRSACRSWGSGSWHSDS